MTRGTPVFFLGGTVLYVPGEIPGGALVMPRTMTLPQKGGGELTHVTTPLEKGGAGGSWGGIAGASSGTMRVITMMTFITLPEGGLGGMAGMIPTVVVIGVIVALVTAFHLDWVSTPLILMHPTVLLITIISTPVDLQPRQSDRLPLLISVTLKM